MYALPYAKDVPRVHRIPMGSPVAKMRLGREQQLECYIRWGRRLGEEFMGLVAVRVYRCTEVFRAILMESVVLEFLSRPILEEVLGGVGAIVDLWDVLDCLILDL